MSRKTAGELGKHVSHAKDAAHKKALTDEQLRGAGLFICHPCSGWKHRTVYFARQFCSTCTDRHANAQRPRAHAAGARDPNQGPGARPARDHQRPEGRTGGGRQEEPDAHAAGERHRPAGKPGSDRRREAEISSARRAADIIHHLLPSAAADTRDAAVDAAIIEFLTHEYAVKHAIELARQQARARKRRNLPRHHSGWFYGKIKRMLELACHGYVAKASRTLAQSKCHQLSSEVIDKLNELHPRAYPNAGPDTYATKLALDEADVRKHVPRLGESDFAQLVNAKAKAKIAAGASGLTFERLDKIVGARAGTAGLLTIMTQHLADGKASPRLRALINKCKGIAFDKGPTPTCPGVRPIAMGETLLKCAQQLTLPAVSSEIKALLGPHSFTFGVSGGANTYALAVQASLGREGTAVLQLDVRNAFNTLSRKRLFDVLAELPALKAIWPLVTMMYGEANDITFADMDGSTCTIHGEEGGRQGDVFFSFLHDLCYRPILDELEDEFPSIIALNYADDPSVVPSIESPEGRDSLVKFNERFRERLQELNGQEARNSKAVLYVPAHCKISDDEIADLAKRLGLSESHVSRHGVVVGGVAIGRDDFKHEHADAVVDSLVAKLSAILTAKRQPSAPKSCSVQACATLVRAVVLPGFVHIIRGHDPAAIRAASRRLDDAAFEHFLALCNIHGETGVPLDTTARTRFFLPLALGGFGMMSAEHTAPAAYVSAFACAARTINHGVNIGSPASPDFLRRTNTAARGEAAAADGSDGGGASERVPRPEDTDDFGPFGASAPLPGSYSSRQRDTGAELRAYAGDDFDPDLFPGLRAAWDHVSQMGCVAGLTLAHFLLTPRHRLQKDLSTDLGRHAYDTSLLANEDLTPIQLAQTVESTGGLLRFGLGAFPVAKANRVNDMAFVAVARELLYLGQRDASDPLASRPDPVGKCRACGKDATYDDHARYADSTHTYLAGSVCAKLHPLRTRFSSVVQQAALACRRLAKLADPLGPDRFVRDPESHRRTINLDKLPRQRCPGCAQMVMCDDAFQQSDGSIAISDTSVIIACVKPGEEGGWALRQRMDEKLAIYRDSHGYPDADQYHIIVTGFGQMHEHTAMTLKNWARLQAADSGQPVSRTTERSLERLGCAVLRGLGDSLVAFDRSCAPFPGPFAVAGAPSAKASGSSESHPTAAEAA